MHKQCNANHSYNAVCRFIGEAFATADSCGAHITVNNVPAIVGSNGNGGHVLFYDSSSAEDARITLRADACCNGVQFYHNATAARALITGSFTVIFGAASGSGTYTGTGTVNFEGDLKPGNSPAAISFAGDVALGPDATLNIEIGGMTSGTQYDQINVIGKLTLGGTLKVSLINGFVPSVGQTFDFLNWGSVFGAFATLQLPSVPSLAWDTSQLATGILTVVPASLPGDFNHNGTVDAADYVVWRKTDNTPAGYNTWRTHFGQTAGSGAGTVANAAVPEPATLIMMILAAAGCCLCRRRSV